MPKSVTYVKEFDGEERHRVAFLPAEHRQLEAEGWVPESEKSKPATKADEPAPRTRRAPAEEADPKS